MPGSSGTGSSRTSSSWTESIWTLCGSRWLCSTCVSAPVAAVQLSMTTAASPDHTHVTFDGQRESSETAVKLIRRPISAMVACSPRRSANSSPSCGAVVELQAAAFAATPVADEGFPYPAAWMSASRNAPRTDRPPPKMFQLFATATMSCSGRTRRNCPPKPSPAHTSTPSRSRRHH